MQIQGYYTQNWQINSSKNFTGAVKALVAANILVFAVRIAYNASIGDSSGLPLERILGLNPVLIFEKHWLWQYATYFFVHADVNGILGLIIICLLLWWCGSELESAWSARRFIFFYITTGVAAGIAGSFFLRTLPEAGSSACAMAIIGAYGYMFSGSPVIGTMKVKHLVIIMVAITILTSLGTVDSRLLLMHNLAGFVMGIVFPGIFAFADAFDEGRERAKLNRHVREFSDVSARVDALLDKINRTGLGSLTAEERKFLEKASRYYKK